MIPSPGDLVLVAQRGLNIAPIADPRPFAEQGDLGHSKVQRYALQLGRTRVMIRHRHADPTSVKCRRDLNIYLEAEPTGNGCIDIGDFNEFPQEREGVAILFPKLRTFRRGKDDGEWLTTIDGAVVSDALAMGSSARGFDPEMGAQHRPAMVTIDKPIRATRHFRWQRAAPIAMGKWTEEDRRCFSEQLDSNIDEAWNTLFNATGACRPSLVESCLWGGWSAGSDDAARSLDRRWKRYRQQLARCSKDGDEQAKTHMEAIIELLRRASEDRLLVWKALVNTRSGAATWIKTRMANRAAPPQPTMDRVTLSANEIAWKLATGLADRWNAGIMTWQRSGGVTTSFVAELPARVGFRRPRLQGRGIRWTSRSWWVRLARQRWRRGRMRWC